MSQRRTECLYFFFFNDTATTEIYTLSLHDALPIYYCLRALHEGTRPAEDHGRRRHLSPHDQGGRAALHRPRHQERHRREDRKSTRLNSSHANISYAVFCLKKTLLLYIDFYFIHLSF